LEALGICELELIIRSFIRSFFVLHKVKEQENYVFTVMAIFCSGIGKTELKGG